VLHTIRGQILTSFRWGCATVLDSVLYSYELHTFPFGLHILVRLHAKIILSLVETIECVIGYNNALLRVHYYANAFWVVVQTADIVLFTVLLLARGAPHEWAWPYIIKIFA